MSKLSFSLRVCFTFLFALLFSTCPNCLSSAPIQSALLLCCFFRLLLLVLTPLRLLFVGGGLPRSLCFILPDCSLLLQHFEVFSHHLLCVTLFVLLALAFLNSISFVCCACSHFCLFLSLFSCLAHGCVNKSKSSLFHPSQGCDQGPG